MNNDAGFCWGGDGHTRPEGRVSDRWAAPAGRSHPDILSESLRSPRSDLALLDALGVRAALVSSSGEIRSVNNVWRHHARENGLKDPAAGVGSNYLQVCDRASDSPSAAQVARALREILAAKIENFTTEYDCHSADARRWFQVLLGSAEVDGEAGAAIIHLDITDRKLAELKLTRINRLYNVLRLIHAAVAGQTDIKTVYAETCRILVEQGLFKTALVAEVNVRSSDIEVVSHCGASTDYLENLNVTSLSVALGLGTMGTAARTGSSDVCNDFAADPRMAPWQDRARREGYGSTASFPLRLSFRTAGVLTLFAEEKNFFGEDEMRLLDAVANSLSLAAETLKKEAEKLQAETALRNKQTSLAAAEHLAHFGCWELTLEDSLSLDDLTVLPPAVLRWSDALYRIAGLEPGSVEVSVSLFYSLLPPEDLEIVKAAVTQAFAQAGVYSVVHRLNRPDGAQRWVHGIAQPIFEPLTGRPERMVGTLHDITDKRRAEAAMAASELRLQRILSSLGEGIYVLDRDGHVEYENKAAVAMLGSSLSARRGRPVHSLIQHAPSGCREASTEECPIYRTLRDGITRRVSDQVLLRSDGRSFPVDYTCSPLVGDDGGLTGTVVTFRDISERKAQEQKLRDSELRYKQAVSELETILDSSLDVICSFDLEGRFLRASAACKTVWGYSPDELLGIPYLEMVHPEDRQATLEEATAIMQGRNAQSFENRYIRRDGSVAWIQWTARWSAEEQVMFCVARDVTVAREREAKIAEQASLLDKAQDAIVVRDLDHRILYWNASAERMYGWSASEVLGQDIETLLFRDPQPFLEAMQVVLTTGEWVGEVEQATREGKAIIVEGHWTLVRDGLGQPRSILAINTDITERKKLEQQFLRAQRMESIGTLAGGIAHDLNNVLAPIRMAVDLLKLEEKDPERLDMLETIEVNTIRGADMVRQVLSFSRGLQGRRLEVGVAHLFNEVLRIVKDTFPKNITSESRVEPALPPISADFTQMHQVLLNLCVNARDAMAGGGRLRLTAQRCTVDSGPAGKAPEEPHGEFIRLGVEDTGTGIPSEFLNQIFDPFFTSKEVGKGTGLGLSTSMAIVKSHGGFMRVETELGQGTKFWVYLPASRGQEESPDEIIVGPSQLRGNGELVLVVDDEPAIRQVARATLQAFGYRVLVASEGSEAVALYVQHQDEIAVVLTDMMMPVLDGPALARMLLRLNPKVRIIGASGIPGHQQGDAELGRYIRHFLMKPYTAETLLQALRAVILQGAEDAPVPLLES